MQRADDRTAAFYTDRDSGRLVEKAIADAAARRVNVLVEGTMRSPDTVERTLTQFREAGFATDARALAINPNCPPWACFSAMQHRRKAGAAGV
nr:zeta toxin family protein [Sphingomonas cavernae]